MSRVLRGGSWSVDPRLVPLLACVIELLPWFKRHHEIDPDYNQRMGEVFEGFVTEEAKTSA